MGKKRIALLYGGISSERDVSLASGREVYNALDEEKYDIVHYDPKTDIPKLVADADQIDTALIILHGPYGEDGRLQGMLDMLGIPYQGSGVLGSAMAMDKVVTKQLYEKAGIPVPSYMIIEQGDAGTGKDYMNRIGLPMVIKPARGGSSIGMSIVREEKSIPEALEKGFSEDKTLILERYINGTELTAGVLGNESLAALPLIEIVPGDGYSFFDYDAKYKPGATREICPARVNDQITTKVQTYAKMAHRALFCRGYSRTDFMLGNDNIYVLETNTIPGMTGTSLYPQAAKAAGYSFSALLDRLIELSLDK